MELQLISLEHRQVVVNGKLVSLQQQLRVCAKRVQHTIYNLHSASERVEATRGARRREENGNIELLLFLFVNWTQLSSHRNVCAVCSWKLAIHKSSPSSQHISKVHKHKFRVSTSHISSYPFSFLPSLFSQCNFPHNRQFPSVCMLEMFTFPLHPPHSHSKYVNTCSKFPWISKRVVRWFGAHNQA